MPPATDHLFYGKTGQKDVNIFIQIAAHHPLVCITLSFVLGITAGYRHPLPAAWQAGLPLLLSLLLIALFTLCYKRAFSSQTRLTLLVPLSFLLGVLHISYVIEIPAEKQELFSLFPEKKEAVIVGVLQEMPRDNGKIVSIIITSRWLRLKEDSTFKAAKGKILLRMKGALPPNILPGDTIIVRADIKHPRSYYTPGAFDYSRYLAEKGIFLTGFIRSPLFLRKMTSEKQEMGIRIKAERVRTIIANTINHQLPPHQAGLYRAILLGDRSAITPPVLENFKACGVLHLLAISGLHLTVIWSIFYFLCYRLLHQSEFLLLHYPVHTIAALLTLPFIAAYALLSGLQTPVLRAAIMSATLVIALVRRQQTAAAPLLAAAALLILLLHPMQLFSASFQLSFIAVATIFFLLPLLKKIVSLPQEKKKSRPLIEKLWRWIAAATLLSTGISLLTAPITAFHFNRISVVGPLANLFLEPLLCLWALPCGIFASPFLLTPESTFLAQLPLQLGGAGITLATTILEQITRLPFTFYWVPIAEPFFLWGTALFYAGFLLLAISREKITILTEEKGAIFRKKSSLIGGIIIFCSLPLFFYVSPQKNLVTFLDVGQGSATLVEFASGSTILIDGGGASYSISSIGERVIAPYLLKRGKKKIDAVILTHPDADHSNGLSHIIANFSPKTLWVRAADEEHALLRQLLATARQTGCRIKIAQQKERLFSRQNSSFSCLYNFGKPQNPSTCEKNRGLVLLAELDGWKFLFPGDIDKEAEKELLATGKPACNVLLASHHGSKTSNSKEFIDTLNPLVVIASAGQKEGLFPSSQLIAFLQKRDLTLLTTARDGTIEMEIKQKEIQIRSYNKKQGHPLLPCKYREKGRLRKDAAE